VQIVIGKGLANPFREVQLRDPAPCVVLIFHVAAPVVVCHCRDMPVPIMLVMSDPLVRVHHVCHVVPVVEVLCPAPGLIRDLQDTPAAAPYLQYIPDGCRDLFKPVFVVCQHELLSVRILHAAQLPLSVTGAQSTVHGFQTINILITIIDIGISKLFKNIS